MIKIGSIEIIMICLQEVIWKWHKEHQKQEKILTAGTLSVVIKIERKTHIRP